MNSLHSLPDESGNILLRLIYTGNTIFIVSVASSGNNTTELVLTTSGLIAGTSDSKKLLQRISQGRDLRIPERGDTLRWASEVLKVNVDLVYTYDLDALVTVIRNKGLTKSSIESIGSVIKLVYDYRWQVNNMELDRLLDMPSIKKVNSVYSTYIFWGNVPKEKPFIQELSTIDRHQFVADFTKLLASFFRSVEVLRR